MKLMIFRSIEQDITVRRPEIAVTHGLSSMTLIAGGQSMAISPTFSTDSYSYNSNVSTTDRQAVITPVKSDAASNITINGFPYTGPAGQTISLVYGSNALRIEVQASDGNVTAYTLNIMRPSDKANLEDIDLSGGNGDIPISGGNGSYNANVGSNVDRIAITPQVKDPQAVITINGEQAFSGQPKEVSLSYGNNNIAVVITAIDGTTKTYTLSVYRQTSGSSDNSVNTDETKVTVDEKGAAIIVNGQVQENSAIAITVEKDDITTTTVVIDPDKLEQKLEAEGQGTVVTVPVNTKADVVVGELNGQMVKSMEAKAAVLEIKTEDVTYTLPASEINIDAVSEQIGQQVELKDIKVHVTIATPSEETVKIIEDIANKNIYQIIVKPVEFKITCSSGSKTVEVSKFNGYVERTIAIPDGIDPSKITTGIVLNSDGTFSHVPTTIIIIDGKCYAKINSLTNSTYSVIYGPKTFADVEKHWAKDAVNDMGSRLVISGVGDDRFEPDRDITRAEFAAIVVRALGLLRSGTGKDSFEDVTKGCWYYDAVSIACEYGIISGYGNGKFGPNDKITREQAMTMIARAMKLTKLELGLTDDEMSELLLGYADAKDVANYAKASIGACIKTGIVSGRSGKELAPKEYITRAEVATIVQKLLKKAELI